MMIEHRMLQGEQPSSQPGVAGTCVIEAHP